MEMEENDVEYIDDLYESIDAPMYVDFTLPLPEPDDSPAWFCHRIGCTENHDQEIFELPVVAARTSKFSELLAARRKLTSTEKPTEVLRSPLAALLKLSKPKLASICGASKNIQTKASAARVVPTSLGLKTKGKEMMNIKVCGSNAKVGGLLKEKKGEVKAPVFQGADKKNVKLSQLINDGKSRYAAKKPSSISLMKSKSTKITIVCEDRGNKKENLGIQMIVRKEKKENPTRKIYGLTRAVEGKAIRNSSTNLNVKGEKSKLGVDAPKDSKVSLLKVGMNANKLNVKGEKAKLGVDALKDTKISLLKVAMNANKLNVKGEKSLKVGMNGNKLHVKVEKSKFGVDAPKDNKMPFLKEGMYATNKVIAAKKEINGKEDEKKSAEKVFLRRDVLKLGGKSSSEKKRVVGSKVATNERLSLSKGGEGATKKKTATLDSKQFTWKPIVVKKKSLVKEKEEKPVRKVDDIRINLVKHSGNVLVEGKTSRNPLWAETSSKQPRIDGRVDILPWLAETSNEKKKADATGEFSERMEGNSDMENTAFDCNRSQAPPTSPLLTLLDGEDQEPHVDSPQSQPTNVPMNSHLLKDGETGISDHEHTINSLIYIINESGRLRKLVRSVLRE